MAVSCSKVAWCTGILAFNDLHFGFSLSISSEFLGCARGIGNGLAGGGLDLLGPLHRALDVDRANVREADESENASQVTLLKIEGLRGVARLIAAPRARISISGLPVTRPV